jgi:hypothetical protein
VVLSEWVIRDAVSQKDERVATLDTFFSHVKRSGYDGIEICAEDLKAYFFDAELHDGDYRLHMSDDDFVSAIELAKTKHGIAVVGSSYFIHDGRQVLPHFPDFSDVDLWKRLARRMVLDKRIGSDYVTFQIDLPEKYLNTNGEWRDDAEYLALVTDRLLRVRDLCWQHGLNAYFEVHIERVCCLCFFLSDPSLLRTLLSHIPPRCCLCPLAGPNYADSSLPF